MPLILVGLNHRTAPRRRPRAAERRRTRSSTRRRTSLRALRGRRRRGAALDLQPRRGHRLHARRGRRSSRVVDWLAARASTRRAELEKHLYILRHGDVVRHLFRVASGPRLDDRRRAADRRAGKKAFVTAQELGTLDSLLAQLYEHTLRVAEEGAHRDRHRRARRLGSVRGGRAGEEDLRRSPRTAGAAPRRRRDRRADRRASARAGGEAGLRRQPLATSARSSWRSASAARPCSSTASTSTSRECDIVIASTAAPHFVVEPHQVARALGDAPQAQPLPHRPLRAAQHPSRPSPRSTARTSTTSTTCSRSPTRTVELRQQKARDGRTDRAARSGSVPQAARGAGRRADHPRAAAAPRGHPRRASWRSACARSAR